ncbi:DKNYY domain-containing protein [Dyadobacter sp. CY326]|uniref:DKNYY domain-containing protein n=1 Tax=Dyadobacter sp. CY326 TaxID=2907300 RepID=UPI001F25C55E|nr:DKNYY domain-containing protein [Dyadobacter sp. CY326]MCE7063933.1 DKNYY domain-containing protein [Dyadobacter sp. CY326]
MKYILWSILILTIIWICAKFVGCSFKKGVFKPGLLTTTGYHVRDHRVYYYGGLMNASIQELAEVDASTFEVVRLDDDIPGKVSRSDHARDKKHVYWRGLLIPGADPASFKAYNMERSRDKNYMYDKLRAFSDDPDNYKHLIGDLYTDTKHIYWSTVIISDEPDNLKFNVRADSNSMTYLADSKGVFASNGTRMKGVDAATFKPLPRLYSSDKNHVYVFDVLELKIIEGADPASFKLLGGDHAIDKKQAYWMYDVIAGSDVSTFEKINELYAKDGKQVYFAAQPLLGSDPQTFEVLPGQLSCSYDKNHVYSGSKVIPNIHPATLPKGKKCKFCDDERIVFEE